MRKRGGGGGGVRVRWIDRRIPRKNRTVKRAQINLHNHLFTMSGFVLWTLFKHDTCIGLVTRVASANFLPCAPIFLVRKEKRGGIWERVVKGSLCDLSHFNLQHRADKSQKRRNSCPRLQPCFIGFCRVGVSQSQLFFLRSISFAA